MANFLDNFVDADGTLLTAHTSDSGPGWTGSSALVITDDQVRNTATGGAIATVDGLTVNDDATGSYDIAFTPYFYTNSKNAGIVFNYQDANNFDYVRIQADSIDLFQVVGGSFNQVRSDLHGSTLSSPQVMPEIKVEVRPTTLRVFYGGAALHVAQSATSNPRSGGIGIRGFDNASLVGWRVESMTCTNATFAAASPSISDIDTDESVYPGQSYIIQATDDIGATQGTVFWERLDGTDDVQHTVTNWDAATDQITVTAVRGGHNYGSGLYQARVVLGDGTTEILFDNAGAGLTLEAEPNTFAVTAASPNTTDPASLWSGLVDTATGDPVTVVDGDQAWVKTLLDGLAIDPTGAISANETGSFTVQFWRASEGVWGSDQTVSFTLPAEATDNWPFGKAINPIATKNWTWGSRHPITGMRVRIFK